MIKHLLIGLLVCYAAAGAALALLWGTSQLVALAVKLVFGLEFLP